MQTASTSGTKLKQTKEDLEGKDFYIELPLNTTVRNIEINLPCASKYRTTSTGTVWKAVAGENMQPLLSIDRTEQKEEDSPSATYTFQVTATTTYDVALRKYIAAVYRKNSHDEWVVVYKGNENGRVPTVVSSTGTDPFNQFSYNHRKDPAEVLPGDRVIYGISL